MYAYENINKQIHIDVDRIGSWVTYRNGDWTGEMCIQ